MLGPVTEPAAPVHSSTKARAGGVHITPLSRAALSWACLSAFTACGSDTSPPPAQTSNLPAFEDVMLEGSVTDEALQALLDAKPTDGRARAIVFDAPPAQATLPVNEPLTLTFHEAAGARLQAAGVRQLLAKRQLSTPHSGAPWQRWLERTARFLNPVGVAYAHGEPFNGTGFLLNFTDALGATHYSVITSEHSTTLGLNVLSELRDVKQPLTVHVVWADFEENRIPQSGGPFSNGSLTFSLE